MAYKLQRTESNDSDGVLPLGRIYAYIIYLVIIGSSLTNVGSQILYFIPRVISNVLQVGLVAGLVIILPLYFFRRGRPVRTPGFPWLAVVAAAAFVVGFILYR